MDLKQRILQETSQLLFTVGIASMTMDMVARSCGISKRTLYEQFPDKKSLVKECLKVDYKNSTTDFEAIFANASNCFEALFGTFNYMRKRMVKMPVTFHDDLKRIYPDLYVSLHKRCDHKRVTELAQVLCCAQEEGLVETYINTKVAAFLFYVSMKTLHNNKQIAEYGITQIDLLDGAFINFLRGVASAKGLELIKEYQTKNNK